MATESFLTGFVLAAGGSSRLGQPKQLLPSGGATLLDAVLSTARAAPFDQRVVALGGSAREVRWGVDLSGFAVVENETYGSGCSSSIGAALEVVDPRCDVLVLMLGDQPGVSVSTIETLLGARAEAFVFATRLTRVTRALREGLPHAAIERAGVAAPDWAGGTRIGEALRAFTDRFGRRGMARDAVVVVLSDGWERGDPALVRREMARLSRLAYRIVWVNPRVAAPGFAPVTRGMGAALPYVDELISGHSLAALDEVVEAVGRHR